MKTIQAILFLWEASKTAGKHALGYYISALKMFYDFLGEASKTMIKANEQAFAFSRTMGMNLEQAYSYTNVLIERTDKLAMKYGIAAEQVIELQKGISDAISRQRFLADAEAERMLQINKLLGSDTNKRFMSSIISDMGGQLESSYNAVSKAYATAAKQGLNAQQFSSKIADNLKMANTLSFKNGVDGMIKMAAQAEKIGMELSSVEAVAKTFMDFDKSIEAAARLQMLGGQVGAYGANPLDMMYEANYDPEALQDRIGRMLKGYARFDEKQGMSTIDGMGMDFVRNIAQAVGMSDAEVSKIAKRQAEQGYKEKKFGNALSRFDDDQRNFLMNNSYVQNGRLYINDVNGEKHDISGGNLDSKVLEELMKFSGMSDRDIMEQQARTLIDIKSYLSSIGEKLKAMFAEVFQEFVPELTEYAKAIGNFLVENGAELKDEVFKLTRLFIDTVKSMIPIGKWIMESFKWVTEQIAALITRFPTITKTVLSGLAIYMFGRNVAANMPSFGGGGGSGAPSMMRGYRTGYRDGFYDSRGGAGYGSGYGYGDGYGDGGGRGKKGKKGRKGRKGKGAASRMRPGTSTARGAAGSRPSMAKRYLRGYATKKIPVVKLARSYNVGRRGGLSVGRSLARATGQSVRAMSALTKLSGAAAIGLGAFQVYGAVSDYNKARRDLIYNHDLTREEKLKAAYEAKLDRNKQIGSAIGTALGGALGTFLGPLGTIGGGMAGAWLGEKVGGWLTGGEPHAKGGIVGGNLPIGDRVHASLNSGEAVFTQKQLSDMYDHVTSITAKPVGEKEYMYDHYSSSSSTGSNGSTVKVNDFAVNINGTIKLDGNGNNSKIDARELMSNPAFVSSVREMVKESINRDMNGGRFMNDIAVMTGLPTSTSTIGRR